MVVEAGFVSLIRTILFIVLIYFGIRMIIRYLLPFLLKLFIRKQQEKFQQYQKNQSGQQSDQKMKSKKKPANRRDDLGEYVDFEEVEENERK